MVSAELHDEPVAATTTTTTTTPSSSNDKENRGGATTGQAVAADAEGAAPPPPKFGAYQVPLVEKYRPKTLDQVVGNEGAVERLQSIARQGNVPNLILCGPPGTGKTTSVHALARQLLGPSYKDAVLELNASDARGIDVRCGVWPLSRCSGLLKFLPWVLSHTLPCVVDCDRWSATASRVSP